MSASDDDDEKQDEIVVYDEQALLDSLRRLNNANNYDVFMRIDRMISKNPNESRRAIIAFLQSEEGMELINSYQYDNPALSGGATLNILASFAETMNFLLIPFPIVPGLVIHPYILERNWNNMPSEYAKGMVQVLLQANAEISWELKAWYTRDANDWPDFDGEMPILLVEVIRQDLRRNLPAFVYSQLRNRQGVLVFHKVHRKLDNMWKVFLPRYKVDGVYREPLNPLETLRACGVVDPRIILPLFIGSEWRNFFLVFSGLYGIPGFEYTPKDVFLTSYGRRRPVLTIHPDLFQGETEKIGLTYETYFQLSECMREEGDDRALTDDLIQEVVENVEGVQSERVRRIRRTQEETSRHLTTGNYHFPELVDIIGQYGKPRYVDTLHFIFEQVYNDNEVWEERVEEFLRLRDEMEEEEDLVLREKIDEQLYDTCFGSNLEWMVFVNARARRRGEDKGLFCSLM